jgi:hypothetical protein
VCNQIQFCYNIDIIITRPTVFKCEISHTPSRGCIGTGKKVNDFFMRNEEPSIILFYIIKYLLYNKKSTEGFSPQLINKVIKIKIIRLTYFFFILIIYF